MKKLIILLTTLLILQGCSSKGDISTDQLQNLTNSVSINQLEKTEFNKKDNKLKTTGNINNTGVISSLGKLKIEAKDILNDKHIISDNDLTLDVNSITNKGLLYSTNNMKVDFKDIFLNDKAYIYSSGDITITGKEGTFTNKVGDIESEKNIKIEAKDIKNLAEVTGNHKVVGTVPGNQSNIDMSKVDIDKYNKLSIEVIKEYFRKYSVPSDTEIKKVEDYVRFDKRKGEEFTTSDGRKGQWTWQEGKYIDGVYLNKADKIEIFQKADLEYPLQNKRHTFEYLRTKAHLRARTNTFSAVFRVRSVLAYAIHKFFQENNFVYVHTPIITGSDAEGAGEMFRITTLDMNKLPKKENGEIDFTKDFFGKSTNLTVSGQLNVETFCAAFRNVYTFGPTFRAEYSNTARHASEFWMIEPEIAFGDLGANMELAEAMVKSIIKYVMDNCPEEMEFFNSFIEKGLFDKLNNVLNNDFGRVTYTEAIEILEKSGKKFEFPVKWGIDLQSEHERYLAEEYFKKPVFVTDYPKEIKAFYMKLNEDGKTVRAMDLLAPGIGEIIGGSQREDSYEILLNRMEELGLDKESYEFYLDLRRFGSFPHSGYGLGFERMMMYLTGMQNIRDVIPFPRTPNNAEF